MSTTIHDIKKGISDCCGAPLYKEQETCSACKEPCEDVSCSTCEGTGEVEVLEYECNDSTGYNTVVMGTDKFVECPDCGGSGVWEPKR